MHKRITKLEREVKEIKERNARVEREKAWEVSTMRKTIILFATYFVIVTLLIFAGVPDPFINALVPSLAFLISTITLGAAEGWWRGNVYKR